MINSVIHHIGIGLADPHGAAEFFDRLFVGYLGLEKQVTTEAVAAWKGRGTRICLYPLQRGTAPGSLHHLAFSARTPGEVDAFPPWAVRNGIVVTSAPRPYPEYGDNYYAVFFAGPENLRLELVHSTEDGGEML